MTHVRAGSWYHKFRSIRFTQHAIACKVNKSRLYYQIHPSTVYIQPGAAAQFWLQSGHHMHLRMSAEFQLCNQRYALIQLAPACAILISILVLCSNLRCLRLHKKTSSHRSSHRNTRSHLSTNVSPVVRSRTSHMYGCLYNTRWSCLYVWHICIS